MGNPGGRLGDKMNSVFLALVIPALVIFSFSIPVALILGDKYKSPALAGGIIFVTWILVAVLAGIAEGFQ